MDTYTDNTDNIMELLPTSIKKYIKSNLQEVKEVKDANRRGPGFYFPELVKKSLERLIQKFAIEIKYIHKVGSVYISLDKVQHFVYGIRLLIEQTNSVYILCEAWMYPNFDENSSMYLVVTRQEAEQSNIAMSVESLTGITLTIPWIKDKTIITAVNALLVED